MRTSRRTSGTMQYHSSCNDRSRRARSENSPPNTFCCTRVLGVASLDGGTIKEVEGTAIKARAEAATTTRPFNMAVSPASQHGKAGQACVAEPGNARWQTSDPSVNSRPYAASCFSSSTILPAKLYHPATRPDLWPELDDLESEGLVTVCQTTGADLYPCNTPRY